jgi:hypothetical protein
MVLYLLIVACSPAADVWSLDARRRAHTVAAPVGRHDVPGDSCEPRYGWPVALASLVLVVTYVVAGIAKLRYGGFDWVIGDTLRNHVAYAAARLELLGASPSPVAGWAVRHGSVWPAAAAATIVIELAAPLALLGGRARAVWVISTWTMHAAIGALMLIVFPLPLFLVAFAPLYRVERLWTDRPTWVRRCARPRAPRASRASGRGCDQMDRRG